MNVFQSYLNSKKVQQVLKNKPGEAGFSLIELVVVVAVLATLAVIALPQFGNVAQNAARSSAKTTLATIVKECAVDLAMGETPVHAVMQNGGGQVWSNVTNGDCTAGQNSPYTNSNIYVCAETGTAQMYGVNLMTGTKVAANVNQNVGTCTTTTAW